MHLRIPLVSAFLLLLGLSFIPDSAYAQKQVTINRAREIMGVTVNGAKVRKLIGDVSLRTKDMTMFCDSAYQYLEQSKIRAFGNIEINTKNENIWADSLNYYYDQDRSEFIGRVVVENDSTTLFGNRVNYSFSQSIAYFKDGIRMEDPKGLLRAESGFYFEKQDSAIFHGNVQLADSLQYIEGDSLFANRDSEHYKMYGRIFADDQENHALLKGDYLESDSTGRRLVLGDAYLKKFEEEPGDTTHIQSHRILFHKQDTTSYIDATGDVVIWSKKFSSVSDTALYSSDNELFRLRSNPIAWHGHIQLTAPNINVFLADNEIDRLVAYPSPFSVQEDTVLDRLNQITGDTLVARFKKGDVSSIFVHNNSKLLYFTKNEEGKSDGAIEVNARATRIQFDEGSISKVTSTESIDGTYLPESSSTKDKRLDGFAWNPEMRPQKPDIKIGQRLPAIPEERPFPLPERYKESQLED